MSNNRRDFIDKVHATSYDFISPLKLDLNGRVAIVTGAAHPDGVGYATAMGLARAGCTGIVLADVVTVEDGLVSGLKAAAATAGRPEPTVLCCVADTSDPSSVRDLHRAVDAAFQGRLDVLINNAAHQEPYKTILESDADVDWRTWEVNMHGLYNMTKTFLGSLLSTREQHGGLGTMINVASSGALSARAGSANYRSSKLAIIRWTEIQQLDHKDKELLTYCVNPGAIKTNITINEPEHVRNMLPHKADLAGDTITWLASKRREWLGGRYISCPWDMEELLSREREIIDGDKLKMRIVY